MRTVRTNHGFRTEDAQGRVIAEIALACSGHLSPYRPWVAITISNTTQVLDITITKHRIHVGPPRRKPKPRTP